MIHLRSSKTLFNTQITPNSKYMKRSLSGGICLNTIPLGKIPPDFLPQVSWYGWRMAIAMMLMSSWLVVRTFFFSWMVSFWKAFSDLIESKMLSKIWQSAFDLGAFTGVCFLSSSHLSKIWFTFAIVVTFPGIRDASGVLTTTTLPQVELLGQPMIKPLQLRTRNRQRTARTTSPTPVRFHVLDTASYRQSEVVPFTVPWLYSCLSPWLTLVYRSACAGHRSNPVYLASKPSWIPVLSETTR